MAYRPLTPVLSRSTTAIYTNEFKDDWNEMHIATRHSATWRNTYQPQILPYILNIVTLTAIAYSSKRIYWRRAIAESAGCCVHCMHCTFIQETHPDWKWQICSHPVGRRLKFRAVNIATGLSEKWRKKKENLEQLWKINHSHVQRAEFSAQSKRRHPNRNVCTTFFVFVLFFSNSSSNKL